MLGSEMVHCSRGELITSETKLMERWHWSKSKVRYFLNVLLKDQSIDQQTDRRKTRIIIKNYSTYQDSQTTERPADEPLYEPPKDPIKNKRSKEVKTPPEISNEISALVLKLFPTERDLFEKVCKVIASTRRTGKVSPSIILAQLKKWAASPIEQVHGGIKTYLSKGYAEQGKDERYLWGVIRNHRPVEEAQLVRDDLHFDPQRDRVIIQEGW